MSKFNFNVIDVTIVLVYFLAMIGMGIAVMKRACQNTDSDFLAGGARPGFHFCF